MPGVPSGRGCESCRKQKKKCDQAKPSCSRCTRLYLICVGSGQQRYKFQHQQGLTQNWNKEQANVLSKRSKTEPVVAVCNNPSNRLTLLVSAFISTIKATTDIRYNLAWTYGGFLEEIPPRLGTNEALDSSVEALLSAHSSFCLQGKITTEALNKYSRALVILSASLNNPIMARTSETLCAVMLMLICQGLTGIQRGFRTFHSEGAAEILKIRRHHYESDDFESKLLLSLTAPVLFEAIFNRKIQFSSLEWKTLVESRFDKVTYEGQIMRCFAKVPDLMQRGRMVFSGDKSDPELLNELRLLYRRLKVILEGLQGRVAATQGLITNDAPQPIVVVQIRAIYERSYAIGLIIGIILNCVLSAVDVEDESLVSEAMNFSKEVLDLAERAALYKPLGASHTPLCLMAAWIGTTNDEMRSIAEKALAEYQRNTFPGQAMTSVEEMKGFAQQLRLLDVEPY